MKRALLFIAVVALTHSLCCASWQKSFGRFLKGKPPADYKQEYDTINKWLVENVETRDAPDNIIAVRERFLSSGGKHSTRMVEAVQQLAALVDDSFQEIKCTPEAVDILDANKISSRNILDENSWRRIDRVVFHFLRQHSLDCDNVYLEKLDKATEHYAQPAQVYAFVKDKLLFWVDSFIKNEQVFSRSVPEIPERAINFINSQESVKIKPQQNEETGKWSFDKEWVRSLVDKNIFRPCEGFVSQVRGVMVPLLFDAQTKPPTYKSNNDFIKSVIGYHWCNVALKDREGLMGSIFKELSYSLQNDKDND